MSTFDRPWTTPEWWQRHLPEIIRAFQSLEDKACYAVIIGQEEIRCLSKDEYDAMKRHHWQQSDGPRQLRQMAEEVLDVFHEREVNQVARHRHPRDN